MSVGGGGKPEQSTPESTVSSTGPPAPDGDLAAEVARLRRERDEARAEVARLRERGTYLDLLVRRCPVVLCGLDTDGKFLFTEGGGLDGVGVAAGQSVGRSLFDLYPEDTGAHAAFRRALGGETLHLRLDFHGRRWESWFVPLFDDAGRVYQVMSVGLDLTEPLRAEAERRFLGEASEVLASSLEFTTTLEHAARLAVRDLCDLCAVVLPEGPERAPRVVALAHKDAETERRLRQLSGQEAPEIADSPLIQRVLREGQPQLLSLVTPELVTATSNSELQRRLAIDDLRLQSAMFVPLRGRDRTLGVLLLFSSRPWRRYDQRDLALAEELGRRAALAIERAQLYAEAQQAVRAREEFLSIASHELRSPLNTLSLQVQLLLRAARQPQGLSALSDERLQQLLETCERQLRRLTALINRLFDLSRLLSGRLDLNPEDIDLGALAREVAARFEDELRRAGTTAAVQAPDDAVIGRWDRLRMEQVLTNLVSNALKYGEGRPVTITVEREGGLARLTVTDEGMGIPQEHQARIFERFERATPHRSPGSLGLGLYIVRRVLTLMGGSISVRSQPGVGSSFVVELPLG